MAQLRIEKTFIISLPERVTAMLVPLIDYVKGIGLDYSVHSATKNNDGRLGLILSMQQLFTKCIQENMQCILVLEDDCKFIHDNPKEIIDKCMEQMPQDFDMLFLGCYLTQKLIHKHSENLLQLSEARATQSIVYSKSGMTKVLKEIGRLGNYVIPFDDLIMQKIMRDGKTFCSFPNLTSQYDGFSYIEKKPVSYAKYLEVNFKNKTAHLF